MDPCNYIPHFSVDLPVKITLHKIWDESGVLRQLINDPKDDNYHYLIQAQLINHGIPQLPAKTLRTFKKQTINEESITFQFQIKELSYNSMIAFSIWSCLRDYDEMATLGSTTVTLFDDNLKLREGKFNLLLWPNVLPDYGFESKTPGLVSDQNFENLNFCANQLEKYKQENGTGQQESNLNLKLYYYYRTIPAAFFEVSLPKFTTPILFEDIEYPLDEQKQLIIGGGVNDKKIFIAQGQLSDQFWVADFEYELGKANPIQEMNDTLIRCDEHPESYIPKKDEQEKLLKYMQRPIIGEMKKDEKNLFWMSRYWCMAYGAALPKVLVATKWDMEESEIMKLLPKWTPIDIIDDALFLLSQFTSVSELKKTKRPRASMLAIRKYACKVIEQFNDEKIESVLLQLVAAIKYEPQDEPSPLCQFLYKRASQSKNLATLLYWYLNVEQDPQQKTIYTEWYKIIFDEFSTQIRESSPQIWDVILGQFEFRKKLQNLSTQIRQQRNDKKIRIDFLRDKLGENEFQDPKLLPQNQCCLNPDILLQSAIPKKTSIFSSAMAPIKFAFNSQYNGQETDFQFIFKNGDDLRQDQLIMQIFNLMNGLLKGVQQDMKLLPYKILACSKSDGFLEFVPETKTLQDILGKQTILQYLQSLSEDPNNSFNTRQSIDVKQYIDEIVRPSKMGINPQIMLNYVLSSAGYCVITYFLGIGDRHLENILINNEGKMFHIDFGFILGKDPKPIPPPFKFCKEMVEGMGGQDNEYYKLFKQKCVEVYIYLRKYAKLIITLFLLMCDAGIKDYSQEAVEAMYEKFRLEDSDEKAEIHFLNILEESVTALFAKFNDIIHRWASYWRK